VEADVVEVRQCKAVSRSGYDSLLPTTIPAPTKAIEWNMVIVRLFFN